MNSLDWNSTFRYGPEVCLDPICMLYTRERDGAITTAQGERDAGWRAFLFDEHKW